MNTLTEFVLNNPVITIAAASAAAITLSLVSKRNKKSISGKFVAIPHLTTKAEQNFYNQLHRALPDGYTINCKVRLADLCQPANKDNIVSFNKVARKHVDFVVSDIRTNKVLCAIELDDRSHQKSDAIKRDNDKNYALKSAGIPIIRIKNGRKYSEGELSKVLNNLPNSRIVSQPDKDEELQPAPAITGDNCPRCSSEKYQKVEMRFPNKGSYFYECNACSYRTDVFKTKRK